ncbi:MAG TPA: response regulator, partial [Kiloniellaceae bacterium]|nr:response regulator [Kiloniellaceae bacterium]
MARILVAEDDTAVKSFVSRALSHRCHKVTSVDDGVQALEALDRDAFDLLITDIVMPRMDGYELVRKLRQDESMSGTPVIFCSATYHEREVREMARSLGVRSTLSKPYDLEVVRET